MPLVFKQSKKSRLQSKLSIVTSKYKQNTGAELSFTNTNKTVDGKHKSGGKKWCDESLLWILRPMAVDMSGLEMVMDASIGQFLIRTVQIFELEIKISFL